MKSIYADNAATTKLSKTALAAMLPCFEENYGNPSSLHTVGQNAAEALFNARRTVSECIGCDPKEIIFTGGGSEADNQALLTGAELGARKGKKHIISDAVEHHAVLHTLKRLEKQGYEVTILPVDGEGLVDPDDVRKAVRPDTALVTIMMANNEIGTIEPVKEIADICREKGVLFHTDAVQAVGHIPVDVKEIGCDMLS
ncbi:MAG: cysteine desulfurase family protein, partial [Oscillospiraceae bacterium]